MIKDFNELVRNYITLIEIGLLLLIIYGIFVFGKFHPLHFKIILTMRGLISIIFAYIEAVGFAIYIGLSEV